jgi:hypothetical protein
MIHTTRAGSEQHATVASSYTIICDSCCGATSSASVVTIYMIIIYHSSRRSARDVALISANVVRSNTNAARLTTSSALRRYATTIDAPQCVLLVMPALRLSQGREFKKYVTVCAGECRNYSSGTCCTRRGEDDAYRVLQLYIIAK